MGYSELHSLAWVGLEVSVDLLWFWGCSQGAASSLCCAV